MPFRYLFILPLLLLGLNSFSQRNYFFTHISKHEGLSNNAVRAIVQDSLGFIWIATSDGLNRYDGHRFKVFRHESKDSLSLPGNAVESICFDNQGNLWCGGSGWNCVAMLPIGEMTFRRFPFIGNTNASETRDIEIDPLGRVWIGTTAGIYVVLNGSEVAQEISTLQDKMELPVGTTVFPGNSIMNMPDNSGMWMITTAGVNFWDAEQDRFYNKKYNPNNDTIFNIKGCRSMTIDKNGILWTGSTFGKEYWTWFGYEISGKKIIHSSENAPSDSHVQRNNFQSITCGPGNLIWLGNNARKPLIFDANKYVFDTTLARVYPGSLGNQTLRATCFDRDGNIWVGTEQGIYLASKERQKASAQWLGEVSLFQKPRIKSIYPLNKNEILVAANQCVYRWNPEGQLLDTIWPILNGQTIKEDIRYLSRKNENELWLATFIGLYTYDLRTKKCADALTSLPEEWAKRLKINSVIQHVFSDHKGFHYICLAGGIYVFNPEKSFYKHFTPKNSIRTNTKISDYEPRREGGFWFCGSDENELFYVLENPDSLYKLSLSLSMSFIVSTIYESPDNSIWLGSAHNGIIHISKTGELIQHYSLENGLHSNCIYKILESKSGQLIVITSDGIARYNTSNNRFDRIFSSYALSDYIHRDVGCLDADGKVWSFSENIFYSITPEEIPALEQRDVKITGVKILNRELGFSEMLRLSALDYTENTISFDFSIFGFNPEIQPRYEYQLVEISNQWIPLHNSSSVTFTSLPHGSYTFRVRSDQSALDKFTEVKFEIRAPWYATLAFKIGAILLMSALVFLLVYFYTRQKIKAKEREFEKIRLVEKERMRIARDMHDDLGAGLTTIRIMSDNIGKQNENPALTEISDTAVDLVDRMRQIVWTLNEEQNKVEDLLYYLVAYSREFLRKNNVKFSCAGVPEGEQILTSVVRRNIFLATKEILNNTVRHAEASNVRMEFTTSQKSLEILIRDDGKGIPSEMDNKYGNGIKNIRRRMSEINGEVSFRNVPGLEVRMTVFW